MPHSCVLCNAAASPDLTLQYCSQCKSALYCSRACQGKDWKKQHKRICKLINVGHGDMQLRDPVHTKRQMDMKGQFELIASFFGKDQKRFFKLFQESTFDGSRVAALEMKKISKRWDKSTQNMLLFHSLRFLVLSDKKMLRWPNSPLLVLLQFVDPDALYGGDEDVELQPGETRVTPLQSLAPLADPFNYSTHENQLTLAKQLIEHGANVNAVSSPQGQTALHKACYWVNVTNLDFVELLLEEGADPNIQDNLGMTPLIRTVPGAPGAAKFLLNWPTTDVNIAPRSGQMAGIFFLIQVRELISFTLDMIAYSGNPNQTRSYQLKLQQWRDIEKMLVERDP
jgi:hypothetical protein